MLLPHNFYIKWTAWFFFYLYFICFSDITLKKNYWKNYVGSVVRLQGEQYTLFWPDEPEFVRMAARFGATIVPFGVVGEDDIADVSICAFFVFPCWVRLVVLHEKELNSMQSFYTEKLSTENKNLGCVWLQSCEMIGNTANFLELEMRRMIWRMFCYFFGLPSNPLTGLWLRKLFHKNVSANHSSLFPTRHKNELFSQSFSSFAIKRTLRVQWVFFNIMEHKKIRVNQVVPWKLTGKFMQWNPTKDDKYDLWSILWIAIKLTLKLSVCFV